MPHFRLKCRRSFVVLNADTTNETGPIHNHTSLSEWKIPPNVLRDIANAAQSNMRITPKEIQNGVGMEYRPIESSLAAANISRVRAQVRKARKEVDKVDNERVNPFTIIVSFPSIKERIDKANHCQQSEIVDKLVGKYQIDGNDAYCFCRDTQFALFQAPFQAKHWSQAKVLFVDIDHIGCHHFPYLLNVVCFNCLTSKYIACLILAGFLNHQDVRSLDTVQSKQVDNVKLYDNEYSIITAHKEILVDFDDAESKVNASTTSASYHIIMSIARRIPDEPSKERVDEAFDAWVEWWKRPHVLKKLSKAYSSLSEEDWDDLPGTTNPVESINRQSVPENQKLVSLKPLVEHVNLEDRRKAILEVASITIPYQVKPGKSP